MPTSAPQNPKNPQRHQKKTVGKPLQEIAIADLHIDVDTYQRGQIDPHVAKIISTWDQNLFGPPTIILRIDGTYWVADGQQRLAAARQLGFTHVYAKVIRARDITHEAELFTQLNIGPKKLSVRDVYKANLVWGEPVATASEAILKEFGFTAKHVNTPREITAIATLREAWGHAAKKIGAQLSTDQLEYGKSILRWVLTAGQPLINKGEKANETFNNTNLGTLIWVARNKQNDVDLAALQQILGSTTSRYLREVMMGREATRSGSQRARYGARLSFWVNEQAGNELIELPDDAWELIEDDGI